MVERRRALEPADSLRALAEALAPHLVELLNLSRKNEVDDWIDVVNAVPTCERALKRACRTGALPARRIKRRWLARRADLDAWIESHETGKEPPPKPVAPPAPRAFTPAEEHEREMDAMRKKLGMRRLTDAERAERGMPPYDINREYAEHLEQEKRWEEERAQKKRDDNDPEIAAARAAAVRAVDAARSARPTKLPRIRCERCLREVTRRKDGDPIHHECPHRYGTGCYGAENDGRTGIPDCPWCAKEREVDATKGP